jgi:hypothetical protein
MASNGLVRTNTREEMEPISRKNEESAPAKKVYRVGSATMRM